MLVRRKTLRRKFRIEYSADDLKKNMFVVRMDWNPLFRAAMLGHEGNARALLSKGEDPDVQTLSGVTPLYTAASEGHEGVVHALLSHKANPDIPNKWGSTPLQAAAGQGHKGIVNALLAHGASPTKEAANATDNASIWHAITQSRLARIIRDPKLREGYAAMQPIYTKKNFAAQLEAQRRSQNNKRFTGMAEVLKTYPVMLHPSALRKMEQYLKHRKSDFSAYDMSKKEMLRKIEDARKGRYPPKSIPRNDDYVVVRGFRKEYLKDKYKKYMDHSYSTKYHNYMRNENLRPHILKSVTFVTPEEFKTHFEDCVRQVRDAIGSRKYGLLLGVTKRVRVIGDTINNMTRVRVKSTQAFAHVVESVMGRPASVYVSERHNLHNFPNSGVRDWIWFDDGVYSGQQFYSSFIDAYADLPGRIHVIAPYATDKLLEGIDELRRSGRPRSAEFATVCTKVQMPKMSNTIQKLFYRYPRRASSNATPPPPLEDGGITNGASTYVMPHKVPDHMSFAYYRYYNKPPDPYYKK
jgi:hypothetical protein